jgi:hypothetical protein
MSDGGPTSYLIDLIMGVCDRAADFATDLETFLHRARNRAVVERMLLEVGGVREACSEILARLQRQPAPPARRDPEFG